MFTSSKAISALIARTDMLERQAEAAMTMIRALQEQVRNSQPIALQAELDSLRTFLEDLQTRNRREFGKIWYSMRQRLADEQHKSHRGPDDEELQDWLEFQKPNGST